MKLAQQPKNTNKPPAPAGYDRSKREFCKFMLGAAATIVTFPLFTACGGKTSFNLGMNSATYTFKETLKPGESWNVPFVGALVTNDMQGNVRVQRNGHVYYNSNGIYSTHTTTISSNDNSARATITTRTYPNRDPVITVNVRLRY